VEEEVLTMRTWADRIAHSIVGVHLLPSDALRLKQLIDNATVVAPAELLDK
jgi:hypothetical protein